MTDDRCEEIPLVPRDHTREEASLASQSTSLPEADRQRLEALLRELLRDSAIRELLRDKDVVSPQTQAGQ
jgi:hypothetical protein